MSEFAGERTTSRYYLAPSPSILKGGTAIYFDEFRLGATTGEAFWKMRRSGQKELILHFEHSPWKRNHIVRVSLRLGSFLTRRPRGPSREINLFDSGRNRKRTGCGSHDASREARRLLALAPNLVHVKVENAMVL